MNYKEFIQKSDEILNRMSGEGLKSCLHDIARKTPENKRDEIITLLNDSCRCNEHKEQCEKFYQKRLMPDNMVSDRLAKIREVFAKIEDNELCLYAEGYEDYSNGYWDSDWIWEYEDKWGIGRMIEDAAIFAHDCMNDCRYQEAASVFKMIMGTLILVEDENGGDSFELSLDEMVNEKLTGINLRTIALDALYSEYQLQPAEKRAESLYEYFMYPYFYNIRIEDIFSIGREELRDTDMFFESWVDFLRGQMGETAARLLKEGILYYKGVDGLAEMARKEYVNHPSAYLAVLLEYEKTHDYLKMKEIGKEALDKLDRNLKLRGEIAIKTAQAAWCVNDLELMRGCWYEAFYSDSTVPNYLRLFTDSEATRVYRALANNRIEELRITEYSHTDERSEADENTVNEMEYKLLHFFSGNFDKVKHWCLEKKDPLGWSGHFVGCGVVLMLLYLYAGSDAGRACKAVAAEASDLVHFDDVKNLVFMKEGHVFEAEVTVQKGEEVFLSVFCLWKANYEVLQDAVNAHLEWLEQVIDKRIDGIIGGKYRRKYKDVALLAAALGEVKESLGMDGAKKAIINRYLKKYPRHSSFKASLNEYI